MPNSRVPPYPRPVPLIEPDEAPVCPGTIVYETWTDEAEQEAASRAAKRRKRIQECATSYLRHEPVFMLTTSLRGPFEGWKNPWQRKRQVGSAEKLRQRLEIPETTIKPEAKPSFAVVVETGKQPGQDSEAAIVIDDDDRGLSNGKNSVDRSRHDVSQTRAKTATIAAGGQSPTRVRKVEDWLKTNATYSRRLNRDSMNTPTQSSPTPQSRPQSRQEQTTNKAEVIDQNKHHARRNSEPPVSFAMSSNHESSVPTHDSPQRAEFAIMENKRTSVCKVLPSSSLPGFEYRRGRKNTTRDKSTRAKVSDNNGGGDNTAKASTVTALVDKSTSHPMFNGRSRDATDDGPAKRPQSVEMSKITNSNLLPSAQVVSVPAPETEAQTSDELLQEISRGKTNGSNPTTLVPASMNEQQQNLSAQKTGAAPAKEDQMIVASDTFPQNNQATPAKEMDTQEMIAAIKPIEFSTIKKPLNDTEQADTPVTASKRPLKSKKRTSFAADLTSSPESRGSIKKTMRVTKSSTSFEKHADKSSQKVAIYEEPTTNAENRAEEASDNVQQDSLPSLSSMFGSRNKNGPKSILKVPPSTTGPPPAGTANTASTSMKQDAQLPQPGQTVDLKLLDDEDFDLDGAIDELGSYLGTWDPEDEASRLGV